MLTECGQAITDSEHGVISSPGYPGQYPHNRDCVWTIRMTPGKKIKFQFAALGLESHEECRYDFLKVILIVLFVKLQSFSNKGSLILDLSYFWLGIRLLFKNIITF